jgi:thiol-disulfide isomerase/thioredoxin
MKRRGRIVQWVGGIAALLFTLAACGSDDEPESFGVVAYQGADVLGGDEFDFDVLLGQRTPVILNYWAALCPPCRAEMPWFQAAYERHGDDVLLVGIDVGPFTGLGTNEQGEALLAELGITYPAVYAIDDAPLRQLEILSMPSTVFFDSDGEIVGTHAGILTERQLDEWFSELAGSAQ